MLGTSTFPCRCFSRYGKLSLRHETDRVETPCAGTCGEHLTGDKGGVERARKAGVYGDVEDGFGDLLARDTDVECGADVNLELGLAATEGRQDTKGDELAAARVEAWRS
jgi:hypothetical protein